MVPSRFRRTFNLAVPALLWGLSTFVAEPAQAGPAPTAAELRTEVAKGISRVEEFRYIREQAEKLGVRAWLFGGTAASFAHYARWDFARKQGDEHYQKERFDYDYSNIYRSSQDLDIVVDGTPEQARTLQKMLQEEFPHLQGNRTAWEVRLLRNSLGDKEALLDNPDFLGQHTDSNSTGMIELTHPPGEESLIRDLRDWRGEMPAFLEDVRRGELHYYFSPTHASTSRARQGLNPPILSVIRYFTKAFQFQLKIRPEDREHLLRIIREFDPSTAKSDSALAAWMEKHAKKLFMHAVDLEYARTTLDEFGLRDKLIEIGGGSKGKNDYGSLAWWIDRQPLASAPVGRKPGRTIRELGITMVAHETNSYSAFESITKSPTGSPNVFESRQGHAGEAALFGEGFYTAVGRNGARNTGLTIRFVPDPDAVEGIDFYFDKSPEPGTRASEGAFVIWRNKRALRVIPEILSMTVEEYFELLARQPKIEAQDRGIHDRYLLRIRTELRDSERIAKLMPKALSALAPYSTPRIELESLFQTWFRTPGSEKHPEIAVRYFVTLIDRFNPMTSTLTIFREPRWQTVMKDHPDLQSLVHAPSADARALWAEEWLRNLHRKENRDFGRMVRRLREVGYLEAFAKRGVGLEQLTVAGGSLAEQPHIGPALDQLIQEGWNATELRQIGNLAPHDAGFAKLIRIRSLPLAHTPSEIIDILRPPFDGNLGRESSDVIRTIYDLSEAQIHRFVSLRPSIDELIRYRNGMILVGSDRPDFLAEVLRVISSPADLLRYVFETNVQYNLQPEVIEKLVNHLLNLAPSTVDLEKTWTNGYRWQIALIQAQLLRTGDPKEAARLLAQSNEIGRARKHRSPAVVITPEIAAHLQAIAATPEALANLAQNLADQPERKALEPRQPTLRERSIQITSRCLRLIRDTLRSR